MKAMEYLNYGDANVFVLSEKAKPQPKAKEVLVKVAASTVTAADIMMREGKPLIGRLYLGISRPKRTVLGFEFAGEIVGMGSEVSEFKLGDRVFGGTTTLGCYAEYVCISGDDVITTMPENLSFAEAAPVSGSAITVLNFLAGIAKLQKNQKILIIGGSGALGTYAIQWAKLVGADVTAVCSTTNVPLVKALGADKAIDYTQKDFTLLAERYDVIFDTVNKTSFAACKNVLTENGLYLPTVVSGKVLFQMLWTSFFSGKKVKSSSTGLLPVKDRLRYFLEIKGLLATGKLKTVIDRTYPLEQMVEAHTYVEGGHKKGSVVIRM